MDETSAFNQSKWDELAARGVEFGRPLLHLTPETARDFLDPFGMLGDVQGKYVLCLASAGGQQSAAFAVLGARTSVIDLSTTMLDRDRQAAAHYGLPIDVQQGDMRDLSRYPNRFFDLVWQPYSLNFIPDPNPVFAEVARVLRPGGRYFFQFHNPFLMGLTELDWNGEGYSMRAFYQNGAEIPDPQWEFPDEQGNIVKVPGPRAFRHALSAVINRLVGLGFLLTGLWEEDGLNTGPAGQEGSENAAPGSWEHYLRVAPPFLSLWLSYQPDVISNHPRPK